MAEGPAPNTSAAAGGSFDRRYTRSRGHDYDEDPFANFSFTPPKPTGRFRFYHRRQKYQALAALSASRDRLVSSGSNTDLASFGSSQDLSLDPAKKMTMQEDARSRRISAEVMKHRLYESVITSPRRRRMSVRADYYGPSIGDESEIHGFTYAARMVQSLPVTPAMTPSTSQNVTPSQSPTNKRKFFGFFSRGTTPDEESRCIQVAPAPEDNWKGLASIFKPQPRCIPVPRPGVEAMDIESDQEDIENRLMLDPAPPNRQFINQREGRSFVVPEGRPVPSTSHQDQPTQSCDQLVCGVQEKEINAIAPQSF